MKDKGRLEGPWEFGHKPVKLASKTDWKDVWDKAAAGRLDEIPDNIRVTHYNKLKAIAKDHMKVEGEADDCKGVWIYGPSGAGKSRYARDHYAPLYQKLCNKWFDGYQQEENILIEDIDPKVGEHLAYHIKLWADRYHAPGETKGGMVALKHQKLIITSQYLPEEIWADEATREAINRRFKKIKIRGFGVKGAKGNGEVSVGNEEEDV